MAQQATAPARNGQNASMVAGLARFFPEASPVRIPVQFARTLHDDAMRDAASTADASHKDPAHQDPAQADLSHKETLPPANFTESTVIEFGTPREVLFACHTPLEFADVLRLRNSDGSLDEVASVVAVQYQPGQTIVAARFLREVPNWIVKS